MSHGRTLAAAVAGILLTGLLLYVMPPLGGKIAVGTGAAPGEFLFTLVVFAPILLLGLAGGWATSIAAWRPGDRAVTWGLGGGLLGLSGLTLAIAYTWVVGTLHGGAQAALGIVLPLGLLTIAVQVLAEEVMFRGWLQPLVARSTGLPVALIIVAIAFALLHLLGGAVGLVPLLNLALGGGLFGLLAARGQGIAGAVGAHFGWNAGEQLLVGLDPNPGVGSFGSVFDLDLTGANAWGGSADGLNASWAMTFALLAIVAPLALLAKRKAA